MGGRGRAGTEGLVLLSRRAQSINQPTIQSIDVEDYVVGGTPREEISVNE